MKRILASAVVTAVMLAGTGDGEPQSLLNRRGRLIDVGVYAGGSYTTKWAETAVGKLGPSKWNPVFGAQATYWFQPTWGIRANGTYIPSGWGFRGFLTSCRASRGVTVGT